VIRCLPLVLAVALSAAEVPRFRADGTFVSHQIWLSGGAGYTSTDGDVPAVQVAGTATFDQELSSSYRIGQWAALEWNRSVLDADGDGFGWGFGISGQRAPGKISSATVAGGTADVDTGMRLDTVAFDVMPGWIFRADNDELGRLTPRTWQFELGPVVGIGQARVGMDNGGSSDWGWCWHAGLRTRTSVALGRHWRLGLDIGALYQHSQVQWANTGEATFTSMGPHAALALGIDL
jgi:hypothetical protein